MLTYRIIQQKPHCNCMGDASHSLSCWFNWINWKTCPGEACAARSWLHMAGEQGAALGHPSLIWPSQNKPGQPKEISANYYLWNCWSSHNQLKDTCTSRSGSRSEHRAAEFSWEDVFLTLAYSHSDGSQHLLWHQALTWTGGRLTPISNIEMTKTSVTGNQSLSIKAKHGKTHVARSV